MYWYCLIKKHQTKIRVKFNFETPQKIKIPNPIKSLRCDLKIKFCQNISLKKKYYLDCHYRVPCLLRVVLNLRRGQLIHWPVNKDSILGVTALWNDCMAFPADQICRSFLFKHNLMNFNPEFSTLMILFSPKWNEIGLFLHHPERTCIKWWKLFHS